MIRKVQEGWRVVAESGRNMGTYRTKAAAHKRLAQIEMFKSLIASGRGRATRSPDAVTCFRLVRRAGYWEAIGFDSTGQPAGQIRGDHTETHESLLHAVRKHWPKAKNLDRSEARSPVVRPFTTRDFVRHRAHALGISTATLKKEARLHDDDALWRTFAGASEHEASLGHHKRARVLAVLGKITRSAHLSPPSARRFASFKSWLTQANRHARAKIHSSSLAARAWEHDIDPNHFADALTGGFLR